MRSRTGHGPNEKACKDDIRVRRDRQYPIGTSMAELGSGQIGGYSSRAVPTVLGSSGLGFSRMGLGLAALGRPAYINLGHASDLAGHTSMDSLEQLTLSVLDAAYERGVRYFDAARSYGLAEAFLAAWLERPRTGTWRGQRRIEMGLHLCGGLAAGRRRERGQGSVGWSASSPAGGEQGAARGESAPLPNPLRHARERSARGPGRTR